MQKKLLNYRVYEQIILQKCGYCLCKAILMLLISVVMYGWDSEGIIKWIQNPFQHDMDDKFFNALFDEDDHESGGECEESNDDC